ncbi:hypothetical protein GCM10010869_49370 [Mesorhizobium tianshanense]|uniref:Uncharacterized protein n=1 Tax=Mesorhizobium tianshanense TaxID=39844 RepID=A0A562MNH3_9HYPH|nr:hypothetical protein IQ26_06855 [Mesorhizobium tianshanense]GLS39340.1 hypothetical protein GCM10010869_49370 [Mesorhizobium tianshanense]
MLHHLLANGDRLAKAPRVHAIGPIIDDHDASEFVGLLDDQAADVGGSVRQGLQ